MGLRFDLEARTQCKRWMSVERRRHEILTYGESGRCSVLSVGTSVSLSKSRGGSVRLGVETWRVGGIGIARGERIVGVVSRHDPVA